VSVIGNEGKLDFLAAPASAGHESDPTHPGRPSPVDGADAQTLLEADYQPDGQVDPHEVPPPSGREFHFKRSFPKARFNPEPNWEADRLFKSSLDIQLNHLERFDGPTRHVLKVVYRKTTKVLDNGKPGYWNNKSAWERYDARACLIALSEYEERMAFCLCGVPRHDGKNSGCQDITFCPRCNYNRRLKPLRKEYGHCYTAAPEVFFITMGKRKDGSPNPSLTFETLTDEVWQEEILVDGAVQPFTDGFNTWAGSVDFESCQRIYRALRTALGAAIHDGSLLGCFGAPELAVGFLPLRILPHLHVLAFSKRFRLEDAQALLRACEKRLCLLRNTGAIPKSFVADVQVLRVPDKQAYHRVLSYCFKPLKVEAAFQYAVTTLWRQNLSDSALLSRMIQLNGDLEEFFDMVQVVFLRFPRVMRKGICVAKSTSYCGKVTRERLWKRRKEKARRKKLKEAQENLKKNEC